MDHGPQTMFYRLLSIVNGLLHTKTPDGEAEGFEQKQSVRRAGCILPECIDFEQG